MRVLVANRGEIAARLIQALNELDIESIAIYTSTDTLHARCATHTVQIPSPATFMEIDGIINLAKKTNAEAIAPGYGYLSESAIFAGKCREEGLLFVGPSPEVLASLGDKALAKQIAAELHIPMLPSQRVTGVADLVAFGKVAHFPIMIKALDGGGGRGIRIVRHEKDIPSLLEEALNESPSRQMFAEKAALEGFKHVEVQIVADGYGNVKTVFERECSLQRKFQKLIEIAPSSLPRSQVAKLEEAAIKMAKHVRYVGLGTFEFLVDSQTGSFFFMECNPRIQVEHTITEQVSGLDLVQLLFEIVLRKRSIADLIVPPAPRGFSIQCRLNAEDSENFTPSRGEVKAVNLPSGSGIRVDSVLSNLRPNETYTATDEYDSLLAKVVATASTYALALQKAIYALKAVNVPELATNQTLLLGLLSSPLMRQQSTADITSLSRPEMITSLVHNGSTLLKRAHTSSLNTRGPSADQTFASIAQQGGQIKKGDTFSWTLSGKNRAGEEPVELKIEKILKNNFPAHLSAEILINGGTMTLEVKKTQQSSNHRKADPMDRSHVGLPFSGILVEILVDPGDSVREADTIAIVRQGKMELDVRSPFAGTVSEIAQIKEGEAVGADALIAIVSPLGMKDRSRL